MKGSTDWCVRTECKSEGTGKSFDKGPREDKRLIASAGGGACWRTVFPAGGPNGNTRP